MPPSDATDLLRSLWQCVEHAADLEERLRHATNEVAAWQAVARAGIAALDREIAQRRQQRGSDDCRRGGRGVVRQACAG